MGMLSEFREFAMRGNVVDMAVGVVIGGAFGKIVTSLVNDVMMPPINYLVAMTGSDQDYAGLGYEFLPAQGSADPIVLRYGLFLNTIVDFVIVAFCLFVVVKLINRLKRKQVEAPAAEQPADVKLLTEIRDLLQQGAR